MNHGNVGLPLNPGPNCPSINQLIGIMIRASIVARRLSCDRASSVRCASGVVDAKVRKHQNTFIGCSSSDAVCGASGSMHEPRLSNLIPFGACGGAGSVCVVCHGSTWPFTFGQCLCMRCS